MSSQADCIFCKIVAGAIDCYKVYEDPQVLAFLDIGPLSRGHTLVIPKEHYTSLEQMPGEAVAAVGRVLPGLGRAVAAAVEAEGWNLLQNNGRVAGQVVGHVHFHIIPRREGDGLGYRWPAGQLEAEQAPGLVEAIRAGLSLSCGQGDG